MKSIFFVFIFAILTLTSQAQAWKQIANENVWGNAPMYKEYRVNDGQVYSEVRVQVNLGAVRVMNAFLVKENREQLALWGIQGDYVSPRTGGAIFPTSQVYAIRMNLVSLTPNGPGRISIFIR